MMKDSPVAVPDLGSADREDVKQGDIRRSPHLHNSRLAIGSGDARRLVVVGEETVQARAMYVDV